MISLPIYIFIEQGSSNFIGSYKIAVSSVLGSLLLLPFNRNVCLFLIKRNNIKNFLKISFRTFALVGIIVFLWLIIGTNILILIFGRKYIFLNDFIKPLALFLPFMVLFDYSYILLIGNKKFSIISVTFLIGALSGIISFYFTSYIIPSLFIVIFMFSCIGIYFVFKLKLIRNEEIIFPILLTVIPCLNFLSSYFLIPLLSIYSSILMFIYLRKNHLIV